MSRSDWEHGVQFSPPVQLCDLDKLANLSETRFLMADLMGMVMMIE